MARPRQHPPGLRQSNGEYQLKSRNPPDHWLLMRRHCKSTRLVPTLPLLTQSPSRFQKPEVLAAQSNEILTAVVQGARSDETNKDVKLSALRALYNSLEFVRDNMENEVSHHRMFRPLRRVC